jgi:flagellar biosynthesis/type III secretory pathway M-ring protein FliF/YscJ
MPEKYDIPLHEIKPLIEIQEYSMVYLLALCAVALIILLGLLYLLIRWLKNRNKFNLRKEHYRLINAIDFSDTKSAAYALTFYGDTFKEDSERHHRAYSDLVEKLEQFKYKKDVELFDTQTLNSVDLYRGMIDV